MLNEIMYFINMCTFCGFVSWFILFDLDREIKTIKDKIHKRRQKQKIKNSLYELYASGLLCSKEEAHQK